MIVIVVGRDFSGNISVQHIVIDKPFNGVEIKERFYSTENDEVVIKDAKYWGSHCLETRELTIDVSPKLEVVYHVIVSGVV